ncbi:right-handed parallel beta-helix repeat-containing protein, partial [Candidatus Dojkabacteria bacterium]|nr:right-handed parallel beta-helix repeat-containing protein [Candidatus Dojkabacteria bacterium]
MKRQKVVIIEDNYAIREALKHLISSIFLNQVDIFSSDNGVEGLGFLYLVDPDLVLVDSTLPKYSGREIIEYLSTNERILNSKVNILVMSEGVTRTSLPANFSALDKSKKSFVEDLRIVLGQNELLDEFNIGDISGGLIARIVNVGNLRDITFASLDRTRFLLGRFLKKAKIFVYELVLSILMVLIKLSNRRVVDANVVQEHDDLRKFRVRYYPTMIGVLTGVFLVFLQLLLFVGGGIVVMNVRVKSILAAGGASTTYSFDAAHSSGYTYAADEITLEDGGAVLRLIEVADPETGDTIYGYEKGKAVAIEARQGVEFSEIVDIDDSVSIVNAEGIEVAGMMDGVGIHYQVSLGDGNWYYYTGSLWTESSGANYEAASSIGELKNGASLISEQIGVGELFIKALLYSSDVAYSPKLKEVTIETSTAIVDFIDVKGDDNIIMPNGPDPGLTAYYVDGVAGDDSNAGGSGAPLKTIQAAINVADAGDTVYVKGGISYSDVISCTDGNAVMCINTNSGGVGTPITFTSWPGTGIPVIDGSSAANAIDMFLVTNITISNFEIKNSPGNAIYQFGFGGNLNLTFSNNIIHDNVSNAFNLNATSATAVFVYNNTVYNNGLGILIQSTGGGAASSYARNNIVTDNGSCGMAKGGGGDFTSSNNVVWNNATNYCTTLPAGTDDVNADPKYTNAAGGDFTLQSDSPAIDAGADLTGTVDTDIRGLARPNAAAHDIGAYEDGNLYVAGDTGDDTTGDGSSGNPWATIQKAADNTTAGDTVNVKGGLTYTDSNISSTADGTAENRITYRAWPDTGIPTISSVQDNFATLGDYHVIDGFILIAGIKGVDGGTNIRLVNNVFAAGPTAGAIIEGGEVYNNTFDSTPVGIAALGVLGDTVIKNNIFANSASGAGIYSLGGTHTIEDNLFYNNSADCTDCTLGSGNITGQDPQFVNAGSDDYRLMGNSPAIDAGYDVTATVTTDITGKPRSLEGGADIGAYENITEYYVAG